MWAAHDHCILWGHMNGAACLLSLWVLCMSSTGLWAHLPMLAGLIQSTKLAPTNTSANKIEEACKNGNHQCSIAVKSPSRLFPSGRHLKICKCICFTHGLGSSNCYLLHWVLGNVVLLGSLLRAASLFTIAQ